LWVFLRTPCMYANELFSGFQKIYLSVYDQTQGSSAVFALLYTDISSVYWGEGGR
jgi:hypothetical protein